MEVKISAWTFDVGVDASGTQAFIEAMASRVEQSYAAGADIVLFPEYAWAAMPALEGLTSDEIADHIWDDVVPALTKRLARADKLAVLGTAPCRDAQTDRWMNRAIILNGGSQHTQDKLFLTPWESAFTRGSHLRLFRYRDLTVAVVICLDIEVPELSAALRGRGVDLILVPSATETVLGAERVTRCASARAVELGCAVVVSPLVGKCSSSLVDENMGKLAAYLPSQAAFGSARRVSESGLFEAGFHELSVQFDPGLIATMRAAVAETNPSLLQGRSTIEQIRVLPHKDPPHP